MEKTATYSPLSAQEMRFCFNALNQAFTQAARIKDRRIMNAIDRTVRRYVTTLLEASDRTASATGRQWAYQMLSLWSGHDPSMVKSWRQLGESADLLATYDRVAPQRPNGLYPTLIPDWHYR